MSLTRQAVRIAVLVAALGRESGAQLDGRWEGALGGATSRLRLVLQVEKARDGLFFGQMISVDQGDSRIPIERIRVSGDSVRLEMPAANATFDGRLSADRTRISGSFTQGRARPLEFTRAAPDTARAPGRSAKSELGPQMELSVPLQPSPFASGGKTHLAYELRMVNVSTAEMFVTRLEVLDGDRAVATYEGTDLSAIISATRAGGFDGRTIPPAARATAFLWLSLDSTATRPRSLRHRVTVDDQTVVGATTVPTRDAAVIGPPLRGADWMAFDGPGNVSGHRRTVVAIGGRATIPQRFATDWAKLGPNGRLFSGNASDNKSYFGYGAEAIAVADGRIASVKDGLPENVPGADSNAVPTTIETAAGNHVIIELGAGRFALYAHLQPGSLTVKAGDRVRRGQVLGLVGNSGNSSGPHLHFHVSDSNSPLETEGLSFAIDAWEVMGVSGTWERRTNEPPLMNARVRFP